MTYYPQPAPRRRLYHRDWRSAHIVNSERGSVLARDSGCGWIDNDFHLSLHGQAWINAHGAPELFWLPKGEKFEDQPAAKLLAKTVVVGGRKYRLRTAAQTLATNAHHSLGTEFEVKDVRPLSHNAAILDTAFGHLANHAHAAYGDVWQHKFVVKVLTNLGGGLPYALTICAAAHKHEIPTMLLARGMARFNRFEGHTEVTYVRGSAVIR